MSRLPALKYRDVAACLRRHGLEYLSLGGEGEPFASARSGQDLRFHHAPPAMFPTHEPSGCRSRRKEAQIGPRA